MATLLSGVGSGNKEVISALQSVRPDHRKCDADKQEILHRARRNPAQGPHGDECAGNLLIFRASADGSTLKQTLASLPCPGAQAPPIPISRKYFHSRGNQIAICGVEQAKQPMNDAKGLTMLISTLALAMSIAMMVSAIIILYNETVSRKHTSSFK
ncbi:hypothetical protein [Hoeflea sp.]|uniref:hypothetical protein n=1 Tax=Hoeflea sp. TaxID=1940281 RepID=UPI003A91090C